MTTANQQAQTIIANLKSAVTFLEAQFPVVVPKPITAIARVRMWGSQWP